MNIGFDTVGNATVIAYDNEPVIVTDPWIQGSAYFGSWKLSHEIPAEQREAILKAPYVWFSHGHPDHLNGDSLPLFMGKRILLPNHFGSRIHDDLKARGFDVQIMTDRVWMQLTPHIRVMSIPDYNQDAVLFLDVNGRLVFDKNDANDRGWMRFAKGIIRQFPVSFHLALCGSPGADMMNFFSEDGARLPPWLGPRVPAGKTVSREVELYGTRYFVPFSSLHRFQRSDSIWAAQYSTRVSDFRNGFDSSRAELLPAFIRYDCETDTLTELNPPETSSTVLPPEAFGDNWSEPLEKHEVRLATQYLRRIERLGDALDFLTLRVGGVDTTIPFAKTRFGRGLTLEAPRASLMACVRYEIFDDLLIGNFAKVTLHGKWGPGLLYPDVTPYIAKYADNGRARTRNELRGYFREYRNRDPLGYANHVVTWNVLEPARAAASRILRNRVGTESRLFQLAKKAFWSVRQGF